MKKKKQPDKILRLEGEIWRDTEALSQRIAKEIFADLSKQIIFGTWGFTVKDVVIKGAYADSILISQATKIGYVSLIYNVAKFQRAFKRVHVRFIEEVVEGGATKRIPTLNLSEVRRKFDEIQSILPEIKAKMRAEEERTNKAFYSAKAIIQDVIDEVQKIRSSAIRFSGDRSIDLEVGVRRAEIDIDISSDRMSLNIDTTIQDKEFLKKIIQQLMQGVKSCHQAEREQAQEESQVQIQKK